MSTQRACACIWYDDRTPTDARTCLELRMYGRSPVMRRGYPHPEAEWLAVDMDEDEKCECVCHRDEDDDEDVA